MSLREDLREILETVINSGLGLGINKKGEFDSENSYIKKYNYTIKEAEQAILATISKHLPEYKMRHEDKLDITRSFLGDYDTRTKNLMAIAKINGHNEVLDEVNKLLTANKKEGKV